MHCLLYLTRSDPNRQLVLITYLLHTCGAGSKASTGKLLAVSRCLLSLLWVDKQSASELQEMKQQEL